MASDSTESRGSAADLVALAQVPAAHGPAWSRRSEDLDVNLVVFDAGDGVAEHRNDLVDVLIVGVVGAGVVTIDGETHPLAAGQAILVPKGALRGTRAGAERFAYLTCHRRRPGLQPTPRPRTAP